MSRFQDAADRVARDRDDGVIRFRFPCKTVSPLNKRHHFAKRAARVRDERAAILVYLARHRAPALPLVVKFTRVAPRRLDSDNLTGAFKAMRDELCSWLGTDDRTDLVSWEFVQERGVPRENTVEVEIRPRPANYPTLLAVLPSKEAA